MGIGLLLLVIISNVLIMGSFWPVIAFMIALLHEVGHLLMMWRFGVLPSKLSFTGFGFRIDDFLGVDYRKEILIYLFGPLLNLLSACILLFVHQFINIDELFVAAMINLMYGLFNLIPVPPLDGSRIFHCILFEFMPVHVALRIEKVALFSFLTMVVFLIVILVLVGYINWSLIVILAFLCIQSLICFLK